MAGLMLGAVPGVWSALYVVAANPYLVSARSAALLVLYILLAYLIAGAAAGALSGMLIQAVTGRSGRLPFFATPWPRRILAAAVLLTLLCALIVPGTRKAPVTPCRAAEKPAMDPGRADTGLRVVLLGLDGADWKVMRVLLERGLLPNFKRLVDGGAWGPLETLFPAKSPIIWTTIATGVPADRHGITDFSYFTAPGVPPVVQKMRWPRLTLCKKLVRLAFRTGFAQRRPFSSVSRQVPALWNMADHAGLRTGVLNWWCSWPAENINGFMVTQRVTYSPGEVILGTEGAPRRAETHPEGLLEDLGGCILKPEELTPADLSPFVDEGRDALKERIERRGGEKRLALPWFWFSHTFQSDRSFERIAQTLFPREAPDLFLLFHQGIDVVEHFFWHCWEPEHFDPIPEEDLALFSRMIPAYYAFEDRVLGGLMDAAGDNTVFVIVSDHGMDPTGELPKSGDHVETGPAGIFILNGPCIGPVGRMEASVYDIAPTVLYLLGLPVARDMPGRPLVQACHEDFVTAHPVRTIPTYGCAPPGAKISAASDRALIQRLKDIGYLE
jgi:hypothetical protein